LPLLFVNESAVKAKASEPLPRTPLGRALFLTTKLFNWMLFIQVTDAYNLSTVSASMSQIIETFLDIYGIILAKIIQILKANLSFI